MNRSLTADERDFGRDPEKGPTVATPMNGRCFVASGIALQEVFWWGDFSGSPMALPHPAPPRKGEGSSRTWRGYQAVQL
jgi:hypothetical protein